MSETCSGTIMKRPTSMIRSLPSTGCTIDESIDDWISHLRGFGVYFAGRLDLDMLMLESFPEDYRRLPDGRTGPRIDDATLQQAIPSGSRR